MSITMNIHIQDGNVRVFGSDLELTNATATEKATFDRIINAIGSAAHTPPVTDCSKPVDKDWDEDDWDENDWDENDEDWDEDDEDENDEDEDNEKSEQSKKEEAEKALEEMLGAVFGLALLSELVGHIDKEKKSEANEKLKEIFGQ